MFEVMAQHYTEEEVKTAVFQVNTSKAPGKDGFSALFFQKFRDDIKPTFIRDVLKFLNGGDLNEEHNITQIIIIPKVKNPCKDHRV